MNDDSRRLSDFDVTGTVQVSCAHTVRDAVRDIFAQLYPNQSFDTLAQVFDDFRRLFQGEYPGYRGCDTVYHDMQHTLDMTLAMARLIGGWEKAHEAEEQLGFQNATLGIVTALFHDSGYILHEGDDQTVNGAEFTLVHITRGVNWLREYLPTIGLDHLVAASVEVIHFTGYEKPIDQIELDDLKHRTVGKLLGTADLMAQMSDRCYLEKCRDRLYSEFVLGGLAVNENGDGDTAVNYESGLDLLKKTPEFFDRVTNERLDGVFEGVYSYFSDWFDGDDPYNHMVQQNLDYLAKIMETGDWSILRRQPPLFTTSENQLEDTQKMVQLRLRDIKSPVD
ncbi:MAG: hypothetical protein OEQ74_00945 [Gammaproteobacteria bacterium]|nr:hypothetical protein [Gammaproteobacteria bacterium]